MTRHHYFATTSRNLIKEVAQYFVYPLARGAFQCHYGKGDINKQKAAAAAGVVSAGFYSAFTSYYFGKEAQSFDYLSRDAVSAELGKKPEELRFSDYWDSKNAIVAKERKDLIDIQKVRYLSDAMFLVPMAVQWMRKGVPGLDKAFHGMDRKLGGMAAKTGNPIVEEYFSNFYDLFNQAVFAGKGVYWYYETFHVNKSAQYEIVKLQQLFGETGKDISYNELFPVLQRAREDQGLPMYNKREREAVRPLLTLMAKKCNEQDHFGLAEVIYLIGMNKINIYAADGKTISQEVIEESRRAIEKVSAIGLEGIREENRRAWEAYKLQSPAEEQSFGEKIKRQVLNMTYEGYCKLTGKDPRKLNVKYVEYVSSRDPDTADPSTYVGV